MYRGGCRLQLEKRRSKARSEGERAVGTSRSRFRGGALRREEEGERAPTEGADRPLTLVHAHDARAEGC